MTAASPARRSMVATQATASIARPLAASASSSNARAAVPGASVDAPTPTTSDGGCRTTRPAIRVDCSVGDEHARWTVAALEGNGPLERALDSGGSPSSHARATPAMSPRATKPGNSSSAGIPIVSVAVVTTG